MASILEVKKERLPAVKLIGKRYTDADRGEDGSFAGQWQRWFQSGDFERIEKCGGLPGLNADYIGAMRMGCAGFEYWIGMFMAKSDPVPEGFESVEIEAGDLGVCYVYGRDKTAELFGMDVHNDCMALWQEKGWKIRSDGWFLERYNCPRYTVPDEKGNVILDYCAYIQSF